MLREPEIIPLLPKFLQEEHELKGASKGSAYHRLLELLDFTVLYDRENLNRELRRLQEEKRLSAQIADCIHPEEILGFLQTDLGRRMRKAAQNGRLVREQPFVLGVEASEIYPELQSKDMLLVQGIIDVYFEEEKYRFPS